MYSNSRYIQEGIYIYTIQESRILACLHFQGREEFSKSVDLFLVVLDFRVI